MTDHPNDQRASNSPSRPARKPAAFSLDDERVRYADEDPDEVLSAEALISMAADDETIPRLPAETSKPSKSFSFGKWIAIGLGGLVSLSVGLAIDNLIRDLFARTDWLGWTATGLAAVAVLGLLGLALREFLGILRVGKIDHLRDALTDAAEADDAKAAQAGLKDLIALYEGRPETARGRRALAGHMREVIDGRDLVILAERDLLAPLDLEARRIVMNSAKRVSV
ncbi:MAG: TIGR01620 family protein, partial [Roseibium sp.]